MSDTPITAQQALAHLRAQAAEADADVDENRADGIRYAISVLEPFLKEVAPQVEAYLYGDKLVPADDQTYADEPDCVALGRIQVAK